jgi:hypothetical protein
VETIVIIGKSFYSKENMLQKRHFMRKVLIVELEDREVLKIIVGSKTSARKERIVR